MTAARKPAAPKGFAGRMTAKVGPLPVWAWAALILGAILAYMKFHGGSSSSSAAAPVVGPAGDTSTGDTTGQPTGGASGGGGGEFGSGFDPNLNGQLLALLTGLQTSVDGLTAKVQTTPAHSTATDEPAQGAPTLPVGYNPANYDNLPPYASASGPANTTPGGYDLGGLNLVAGAGGDGQGPNPPPPAPAPTVPPPAPAPPPSPYTPYNLGGLNLVAGA